MNALNNKKTRLDPDLSWSTASNLIKDAIHFSSTFTTTIRLLKQNEIENLSNGSNPRKLNENARFSVLRLFKASSIKAPLYYLTSTYNSDLIEKKNSITAEDLVSFYKIDELSAILALVYVFNSLRKVSDKEEWQRYSKYINESVELGGYFGINIPDIGFANSLLFTGMRYLAPAVFMALSPKVFKNYRRDLKLKKIAFDLNMEYDLFGCTHVDVATQLIQSIGFGVNISTDFYKSLMTPVNKQLDSKSNIIRVLLIWVEYLALGKKPPVVNGENEITMDDSVMDRLSLLNKQIQESGSSFSWLSKGKSSIAKELTPKLYNSAGVEIDASELSEHDSEAAIV